MGRNRRENRDPLRFRYYYYYVFFPLLLIPPRRICIFLFGRHNNDNKTICREREGRGYDINYRRTCRPTHASTCRADRRRPLRLVRKIRRFHGDRFPAARPTPRRTPALSARRPVVRSRPVPSAASTAGAGPVIKRRGVGSSDASRPKHPVTILQILRRRRRYWKSVFFSLNLI